MKLLHLVIIITTSFMFFPTVLKYITPPQGAKKCTSPQHNGDKTIETLVYRDGILTLNCEYHSVK